jgi:hypothetical protein
LNLDEVSHLLNCLLCAERLPIFPAVESYLPEFEVPGDSPHDSTTGHSRTNGSQASHGHGGHHGDAHQHTPGGHHTPGVEHHTSGGHHTPGDGHHGHHHDSPHTVKTPHSEDATPHRRKS